jgi:surface protein
MFAFFGLFAYFGQGSFLHLLFLRVDRVCNRPSCLATVFYRSTFNGDLSQWDVAKVTTMYGSKLICIVENDFT